MNNSKVVSTLAGIRSGDQDAFDRLFDSVYDHLHRIGQAHMRRERAGNTLQPTALVHEAYLQLVGQNGLEIQDRAHFLSIAARAMRQVLVQHARRKGAQKRAGDRVRVTFTERLAKPDPDMDLLDLHDALEKLEEKSARVARGVVYRFFGGMNTAETAEALGVSVRTVGDDWKLARAWLKRELSTDQ